MKHSKWNFAIGTTSRVPHLGGSIHYLILDVDDEKIPVQILKFIETYARYVIIQRTEHGWHIYTDCMMNFENLCTTLESLGADPIWIKIAKERGYFFLADKTQIYFPYPVERMVLHIDG